LFILTRFIASLPAAAPSEMQSMEEEESAHYSIEDFAASYNNETKIKATVLLPTPILRSSLSEILYQNHNYFSFST
jgi:hypothetical protein